MSRTAILSVRVVSDTKQAQRGAEQTASSFEKFEKRLDKASMYAAAAGAGLVALGKKAVNSASRLEQSSGAVETVFKKDAAAITKFAETAWDSVGLSQAETQEMATILGSQLKNLGMPMEDVANETINLTKLGADLAATYGGTTSDAVSSLSSLLRGERDPIEKYGVGIKQADIEAEKLALGLTGLTGEAAKQAEIQATLSLLTKQTADAQGQAAREYDSVEAATQRMNASWENTLATLGTALLPLVADLTDNLSGLAQWVSENERVVQILVGTLAGAAGAILGLNAAVKTGRAISTMAKGIAGGTRTVTNFAAGLRDARAAGSAFTGVAGTLGGKVAALAKTIAAGALAAGRWVVQTTILTAKLIAQKTAQLAIATASKVAAAAQWLWNAATNANPIMLIITLIVAAIVLLILNWDKVKAVALVVWDAITTAATWFWENVLVPIGKWIRDTFVANWNGLRVAAIVTWNLIKSAGVAVWNGIKSIGAWIASTFVGNWNRLKAAGAAVWNAIKTGANNVLANLRVVGAWVRSKLVGAWDAMKAAGQRALNAILSPIRSLISNLRTAWDWVTKVFDKARSLGGSIFGFAAAPGTAPAGAPVTAATGPPAGGLAAILAAPAAGGQRTVNINIEIPNYVGERRELVEWLGEALKQADRRATGLVSI